MSPTPVCTQIFPNHHHNIPHKFSCQVEEWLFVVVVALGGDFVVLQVFLSVECNLLGLDLAILHIHLVAAQHNGNVFTHSVEQGGG